MQMAPPTPPLPPPPPPPPPLPGSTGGSTGSTGSGGGVERVVREALQRAREALGEDGGLRELLRHRRDSFQASLQWLLWHRPVPPLIQDGPQCGLVALAMASSMLFPCRAQLALEVLLDTARARGFSNHGEMFSAAAMASLAQELISCRAEILQGGLEGKNREKILKHLMAGNPVLVPYDGDRNHSPGFLQGHKAHWALLNGLILGISPEVSIGPKFQRDPEIPNLFHAPQERGGEIFGEGEILFGEEESQFGEEESRFGEGNSQFCEGESQLWEGNSQFGEEESQFGKGGSNFGSGCFRVGDSGQSRDSRISADDSRLGSGDSRLFSCDFRMMSGDSQLLSGDCRISSGDSGQSGNSQISSHDSQITSDDSRLFSGDSRLSGDSQIISGDFRITSNDSRPFPRQSGDSRLPPNDSQPFSRNSHPFPGDSRRCLVLALQGRSPRPQLWSLRSLSLSNAQLLRLEPRRRAGGFVLPSGGVKEGLQGRAVLLSPN